MRLTEFLIGGSHIGFSLFFDSTVGSHALLVVKRRVYRLIHCATDSIASAFDTLQGRFHVVHHTVSLVLGSVGHFDVMAMG
jgi:hypothetical protein